MEEKFYSEIIPRKEPSEWVRKLKNQAGDEARTSCTDHYAWKAAEYIEMLEDIIPEQTYLKWATLQAMLDCH